MSMIRARLTLNKRLNATLICQPYKRLLHSSRAIAHQHKDQEQIPDHEHNHDPTIEEHGLESMLSHSHSHGHSHSHSGENAFLTLSKDKVLTNPGVRITWIGLGSNVLMAVGKFFGGIAFHSQALLADSVHAMSDLVSDFLTLFSVSLSSKKSNDMYPYGYGKVETVGSLAVSTILAGAGVSIGWSSLCAIVGPIVPHTIIESLHNIFGSMIDFSGSHSHSHTSATDVNAAWIAGGSIIMKEWIFQATKRVAIKTNSNVLMANAWHHRIDSLTSLVALVAISSSYFFGIQSLDSLGGLLVSVLIIKAGGEGMVSSVKELTDQSLSKKDERYLEIESILKKQIPLLDRGNLELDRLVVMPSGPKMRAITTLSVPQDSNISVHDMDNVTAELRKSMLDGVKNLSFFDVRYTSKY